MKKFSFVLVMAELAFLALSNIAFASSFPPPGGFPTTTDECKDDGWRNYGYTFKNQGDCESFVVTDGKNAPDGPPIN